MYSLMRQPHRPTAVEYCVSCKFLSPNEESLVVAGSTQLQVYSINESSERRPQSRSSGTSLSSSSASLELVLQCSLHGVVAELQSVRVGRGGRDALLVAFDSGKISLIEYDTGSHDFVTVAILNAELDEYQGGMHQPSLRPLLRMDPEQRCAILLVYDRYLIVCPFRGDEPFTGRSVTLPHYAVSLHSLDSKLHNVLDLQFLHGYYEPTIFILFEPTRTCPGRVAIRQDTVSLLAVSLGLTERVHPTIWSFDGLPCDCFKVLPVPKPIGGVVVFAVNSLLYLNQSVPPYSVSLNSIAEASTGFPLRQQAGVNLALDCAQACFLSHDRFVMSLRTGEIYVVGLKADNMRMVRGFQFDKAAASVLTCCICTLSGKFLLLGSRLGNSLLLRYTQKTDLRVGEPASKRRSTVSDWFASGLDEDELEVYGSALNTEATDLPYVFEVCDSLINIGPLSSTSLGEPSNVAKEYVQMDWHELQLVSCSGYGKNGSLTVLQQTVLPQLITTFELQGCTDMWTVLADTDPSDTASCNRHAFLILTQKDRTMVLHTGTEIQEIDQSGFDTSGPTVYAGNIGDQQHILQVCHQGVRLLHGDVEVQYLPLIAPTQFVRCSIAGPYALLQCEDGTIHTVTFSMSESRAQISLESFSIVDVSPVTSCCLFRDSGTMFNTDHRVMLPSESLDSRRGSTSKNVRVKKESVSTALGMTVDEEDELLYGGADDVNKAAKTSAAASSVEDNSHGDDDGDDDVLYTSAPEISLERPPATEKPDAYWCVICRQNGSMEISRFPEMTSVFTIRNFANAPRVLVDNGVADSDAPTDISSSSDPVLPVLEILAVSLGPYDKPFLMARSKEDLQIYQAFQYPSSQPGQRLNVRFSKVKHDIVLFDRTAPLPGDTGKAKPSLLVNENTPLLRWFNNVGSFSGVFMCGPTPYWIFMTQRGVLRCHPMMIDGLVTCFAPFDNVNCHQGFLYFNAKSDLRIATLPRHLSLDADWPIRKIPLRCTPHFVSYHPDLKLYGVVTSKSSPRTTEPHTFNKDEAQLAPLDEGDRFVYPESRKYSLQLYSPITWEPVPNVALEFEDSEVVVGMQVVRLNSEASAGMTSYFALCTCTDHGEEVTVRSKAMILDAVEIVPEPDQPTGLKLKACYDREMKGPCSAIGSVRGHFAAAVGQKVYIWSFADGKNLIGVAFVDTQLLVHTMSTSGDYIIVGDIQKSIALLRFDAETHSLSIVSRDTQHLEVVAANYLYYQKKLGFMVSDMMNNLIVFNYTPEVVESEGGRLLLRRADIHIGTRVNSLWRTPALPTVIFDAKGLPAMRQRQDRRQVTWFNGMDGSVGYVLPVNEKTYRRLLRLQDKLMTFLPHYAGLHPKAFRLFRSSRPALVNPHRNILDGDLLLNFMYASKSDQHELARSLGTTPNTILSDLVDMTYSSSVY